jgi:hypothetical protein
MGLATFKPYKLMNYSKIRHISTLAAVAVMAVLISACSSTSNAPEAQPKATAPAASPTPAASKPAPAPTAAKPAPASNTTNAKSIDGKYTGEIVGKPAPNSKFAKLKIGMEMAEIQTIMGRSPDRWHSYESGKRWIPFYYGNDARRVQALYKGEGCLIVTGGNIWGGGAGDLIQMSIDPTGACYQP